MTIDGSILIGARDVRRDVVFRAVEAASGAELLLGDLPASVHVHFFGTATLSFSDGVTTRDGDVFEIEADAFSLPVRNPLVRAL